MVNRLEDAEEAKREGARLKAERDRYEWHKAASARMGHGKW